MKSSLLFAISTVRVYLVVLLLGVISSPFARGHVLLIYQPLVATPASFSEVVQETAFPQTRSAGAEVRTNSGVRSRRRNAKPRVQNGPETVLYTFQGGSDGSSPIGDLIFDSAGNLYGTTQYGGGGSCSLNGYQGCGTVFELSPNGNGGWTETILYSFQDSSDGEQPSAGLIFDGAGNLYGTTSGRRSLQRDRL
jgi:hypothetical protein